jgi:predicted phage terminase large subunit-like protein
VNKTWDKILNDYELHCQRVQRATALKSMETDAEKKKRISKLELLYETWFEYYFPHYAKKKCAKFHKQFAKLIIENKKIRALWEVYRSGAKSVHAGMGIPLYLYFVKHDLFFMLLIGETELKAKRLLSSIQVEIEHNQRLINDYGSRKKIGDWSDGNLYTTDGVRFTAIGSNQSPRGLREGGNRPDYINPDDLDSRRHLNNDRLMAEGVEYITEECEGCFDTDSDSNAAERLVYTNNNFHKNSITNRLKKHYLKNIDADKKAKTKTDYHVVSVPAVKNLKTFEPTWPEKTTADYWRKKYNRNPKGFLREYQHTHVEEGKVFKADWIQHRKSPALSQYDALVFEGDLSYKDKGDFKGLYLVGKKGRQIDIIHSFLRQTSRKLAAAWLYDLYEDKKLADYNIDYNIDGAFAQDEFVNDFDSEGDERGYHIAVTADKASYGNKHDHIESVSGTFERLWVFFNSDEENSADQAETISQVLSFEKGSQAHDDGPDAIARAIKRLNKATFQDKFTARVQTREYRNKRH